MPAACAISETLGMSSTSRPGLPMVSAMRSRVLARMAALKPSRSRGLTKVVVMPKRGRGGGSRFNWPAVGRGGGENVIACIKKRGNGKRHRGLAAGGANGPDAFSQCREPLLQHRRGRIRDAGIDVPGALQIE